MKGFRPAEAEVGLVPAAASGDVMLVDGLAALVNEVYAVAEEGLWLDGVARTTSAELAGLIRASELVVARREGAIVGCVRVQRLDDYCGEFGMLAANPAQRGTGVGRALLRFAEELSTARGLRRMQLELLVPRDWAHPIKTFLEGWYTRSGYRLVRTDRPENAYPHLAPFLATACDYRIYHKALPPWPPTSRLADITIQGLLLDQRIVALAHHAGGESRRYCSAVGAARGAAWLSVFKPGGRIRR